MRVLHGEDDQWEDINESTDEEANEGGTEDDGKEIDGSGDCRGLMKVKRILSLENGQVGLTQSEMQLLAIANVIAWMKVIRHGLSLKVIQSKRNFMVLIEFANS